MTNEEAFYGLWKQMPTQRALVEFPLSQLGEEDFELAEAMVGEGLNRLMEFKTQLLNAKYELQTSHLQRGVLPQTEEGKESVCAETLADKAETERLVKEFRSQPIEIMSKEGKESFGQAEITVGGVQSTSGSIFDKQHVRSRINGLQ